MRPVVLGETDVDVGLAKDDDRRADLPGKFVHVGLAVPVLANPVGAVGMLLDVRRDLDWTCLSLTDMTSLSHSARCLIDADVARCQDANARQKAADF